jgi:hypothetical protein
VCRLSPSNDLNEIAMQVGSSSLAGLDRFATGSRSLTNQPDATGLTDLANSAGSADSADSVDDPVAQSAASDSPSQDDAVHLSADGASAASESSAEDGSASDLARTSAAADGLSAVKSFAYGTLGLERPDQPQQDRNAFYTADAGWRRVSRLAGSFRCLRDG